MVNDIHWVLVKWSSGEVSLRSTRAASCAEAASQVDSITSGGGTPIGVCKGSGFLFKAVEGRPVVPATTYVETGEFLNIG